jgi:hypothetical protein
LRTLPPLERPLEELPDEDRPDDEDEDREEDELEEEIRGMDRGADDEPEPLELDPRLTVPRDAVPPLLPVMER